MVLQVSISSWDKLRGLRHQRPPCRSKGQNPTSNISEKNTLRQRPHGLHKHEDQTRLSGIHLLSDLRKKM